MALTSIVVRHSREELMRILENKCSEALKKLPKPEAFSFESHDDKMHLHIGQTPKRTNVGVQQVWAHCHGDIPNVGYKGFNQGEITTIKLEGVFRELLKDEMMRSDTDAFPAFDPALKLLISFVFVYCGHRKEFADLESGVSVSCLVRRLEKLAPGQPRVVRMYPLD